MQKNKHFCGDTVLRVEKGLADKGILQKLVATRATHLERMYEFRKGGRNPFTLWNRRGKNPCRALAVGVGSIASELELIFTPDVVAERVRGKHASKQRERCAHNGSNAQP
jgi:hypothetical protein